MPVAAKPRKRFMRSSPIGVSFTVREGGGSGLAEFIARTRAKSEAAMLAGAADTYGDVRDQLGPHLSGEKSKGKLESALSVAESSARIERRGNLLIVGIGPIAVLDALAPHWKFLEYGTYAAGEGEWPGDASARPRDSPRAGVITVANKTPGVKGVAPNRAWRMGRFTLKTHVDFRLQEAGFRIRNPLA